MAKYHITNYTKFGSLFEHLPPDQREQFQATIVEGQLLARTLLQVALDPAETTASSVSRAVVMCTALWLKLSGYSREIQNTVKDLSFDG